jgi:hypothetical protein
LESQQSVLIEKKRAEGRGSKKEKTAHLMDPASDSQPANKPVAKRHLAIGAAIRKQDAARIDIVQAR